MNLERECAVAPVCGVTCENCPAHANIYGAPTNCRVMNAIIGAYEAQEKFWKGADMEDILYNIAHGLNLTGKELNARIKEAVRDMRG